MARLVTLIAGADKNRAVLKKHRNAPMSELRKVYGRSFAPGMPDNEKLIDVIHQLDERSLSKLAGEDHRTNVE